MQFKANAIIIAPLFGLLTACGSSNELQSGQTVAQLFSSEARAEGTVAPAPPQSAARGRGPKSRTKEDTGRTAAPAGSEAAVTPCSTPPTDSTMRRRGPKVRDNEDTGRTVIAPVPAADTPATTPCPAPAETPDAARLGGPKGGGRDKILTN